jgi:hypothetical protein
LQTIDETAKLYGKSRMKTTTFTLRQEALLTKVVRHFKLSYSDIGQNSILEQVSTTQLFPCFIEELDYLSIEESCTKEEIQGVLKGFSRKKVLDRTGGQWNSSSTYLIW